MTKIQIQTVIHIDHISLRAVTLLQREINQVRQLAQTLQSRGLYERADHRYAEARRLNLILDLLKEGDYDE